MTTEPEQSDSIDGDERQLCLNCIAPNKTTANFCTECGAPLSSYAATGPFELAFAEGHVYRLAAERPRGLLVVIGMWLIFGQTAFWGVGLMLFPRASAFSDVLLGGFGFAVATALIAKTTRNYASENSTEERHEEGA